MKTQRGFTIMEVLAVISIISIMAVVAISETNGVSAGASSKQGAVMAADVVALARSEAVQTQGYAAIVVDASTSNADPGKFLHRMMVVDASMIPGSMGSNIFTQVSSWYDLPTSVFFDPGYSTPQTTYLATINNSSGEVFNGSAYIYTFTPGGQLASAGQIILAVGHKNPTTSMPIFEDGTSGRPDTRQGFYLHLLGRPSFFPNPTSIPNPSSY